jgi:hypothetical protein
VHCSIVFLVENLPLRQSEVDKSLQARERGALDLFCFSLPPSSHVPSDSRYEDVCADDADRIPADHEGQGDMLEDISDDIQAYAPFALAFAA